MKSILALILFLSSVAILVYAVDFLDVLKAFEYFHAGYYALACIILFLHFLLRGYRLHVMTDSSFQSTAGIIFISNLVNLSLPLRLGELTKIGMLTTIFKIPPATSTGLVVVERGFDLGIVFIILLLALTSLGDITNDLKNHALLLLIVFFTVAFGLWAIKSGVLKKVPKLLTLLRRLGLQIDLFERLQILRILIISTGIWTLTILFHGLTVLSVGYHPALKDLLVITLFNSFLISLPSSPGFVGPYQLSFVLAAQTMGINEAQMTAASLLSHASNYIVVIPACICYLKKFQLGFRDLTKIKFSSKSS